MRIFSNTIFSVIAILLIIASIISLLIFGIREGYLNKQVKYGIELYFSYVYSTPLVIDNLSVNHKGFVIDRARAGLPEDNSLSLDDLWFKIEFKEFLKRFIIISKVNVDKVLIINQKQEEVLNTKLSMHHKFSFRTFNDVLTVNLAEISGSSLADPNGANLPGGSASCLYKSNFLKSKTSNCKIGFGTDSYAKFDNNIKGRTIRTTGVIHNIPIMIYQIAAKLIPQNEVIVFLQEYVRSGHIIDGEFNVNLDEDFWQRDILKAENLQGKFNITNLEYQYDKDLLPLKNVDFIILLSGSSIKFATTKGYIGESLISKCNIDLDWKGLEESIAFTQATVEGPATDLVSFISPEDLQRSKKNGIDLWKITGNATTDVNIEIPMAPGTKNIYNISSTMSDGGLKIFDNHIELSKANITGVFDGQKIALNGEGNINGFDSNLTYQYNIEDQNDYEHLLQVQTKLKGSNTKIGMVKLLSGNALAKFEYRSKGNQTDINLTSDLKNLEFHLDKISIHKNIGHTAYLSLKGNIDDDLNGKASLNLSGGNNLKITGDIVSSKGTYSVQLPTIRHSQTSLTGQVTFTPDSFIANIKGEELDLSEANMTQFLEKERDSTNTKLNVKVDRVRLKNNIFLTAFALNVECDKIKCFKGALASKVGSKDLSMSLTALEDQEEWLITTGNAGAVFLGIDMFKDMRSGIATIKLNTKRRQVKKGEEVPILDGTFKFEKFILTNQSFLTQLVSYISLPGLMNLVTNNKNIRFNKFTGRFNFVNNTLEMYGGEADGEYFDFTMKGKVDTVNREINLKGQVVPSIYGISNLLRKLPILGKVLSGGHRKGIVSAPYRVKKRY